MNLKNRTINYHSKTYHFPDLDWLQADDTGGRCLGGSSATNGLFYGLGSEAVYNQWETDGNPGWNWSTIQNAAKRVCILRSVVAMAPLITLMKGTKFVGNPNHTNDRTFMTHNPDNYGTDGPLKIGFQGKVVASNPSFMRALSALGVYPVKDQNGGSPVGIKQGTMTLDENFMRSSAYDSYYMRSKDRSNLSVLSRAIVARLIFNETTLGTDEVRAIGVTFVDDISGVFHNVSCTKEVVLSAGAFHSPFILKQSGIGPSQELEEFGITPIVVNENVGMHMQDHTSFSVVHAVKPEFADVASTTDMVNDLHVLNSEQKKFYAGGESRWNSKWSAPSGCTNGFQEISNQHLESFGAGDIVKQGLTHQAHNEILYESVYYPQSFTRYGQPETNTSYISVTVSNLAALSKGSVKIGSNFALSDPVIDPNVCNSQSSSHSLGVCSRLPYRSTNCHSTSPRKRIKPWLFKA